MMFLNERGAGIPLIIDSGGYQLTAFSYSSTKHYLAFADEIGEICFYVCEKFLLDFLFIYF